MEEAGEAATEATILVINIGIEDTDCWGERDEVVVSDGGWNEAAVAFAEDDFIACGAHMEFAVAIDAHGDYETIVFQQVAMEWLADFKDTDAEIWWADDEVGTVFVVLIFGAVFVNNIVVEGLGCEVYM